MRPERLGLKRKFNTSAFLICSYSVNPLGTTSQHTFDFTLAKTILLTIKLTLGSHMHLSLSSLITLTSRGCTIKKRGFGRLVELGGGGPYL